MISLYMYLKGCRKEEGQDLFLLMPECRTWNNQFKLQQARFRLDIRKSFLTLRAIRQWNQLPREVLSSPTLKATTFIWANKHRSASWEPESRASPRAPGVVFGPAIHTPTAQAHMEHNPENASLVADNVSEPVSGPDELTEPPYSPRDVTDPLDGRDEETRVSTKGPVEQDRLSPGLAVAEGERDSWVQTEQSNGKQARALVIELEKMRLDMELTVTRYRYEDKEKQRRHEEKMEEMRLQAPSAQRSREGCHFLLPQDQFTLFLYCFVCIHVIYIAKELVFFFIKKHEMLAIGALLICAFKLFWK